MLLWEYLGFELWWVVPVIMIVMCIFCFFMMKRMHGTGCSMGCCIRGGHGLQDKDV